MNDSRDDIRSHLTTSLAQFKKCAEADIDPAATFASLGLGSLDSVELAARLEAWLGRPVAPTVFWDHPSIDQLSAALSGVKAGRVVPSAAPKPHEVTSGAAAPLAVVGMACRFPGAADTAALWTLLSTGGHAIKPVAERRWPACPDDEQAGLLDAIDGFDAGFFGISPAEAADVDPQQRLLLEVAWEALENAGIRPRALKASRTGVFVGISSCDYARTRATDAEGTTVYAAAGAAHSIAANRISYVLGLNGPSLAIDTACSSSLVALHVAARSLAERECDLAIVGGVNVILDPDLQHAFRRAGMLAPDGRCKAFDNSADGYVRGEGCGVVVMRRQDDGEPGAALAILRATAVNQDGRSNGLLAPNREAQVTVVREALANAGLTPRDIDYLECHGTGTRLGDAIELGAIAESLLAARDGRPLPIGSIKANLGHLEAAAGMAGLIKAILVLRHRTAPPLRLPTGLNQAADAYAALLRCPDGAEPLPAAGAGGAIWHASISSFGFGGTNAHAILSSAPRQMKRAGLLREKGRLLLLSARESADLGPVAARLVECLRAGAAASDVCHTWNAEREAWAHRKAVLAADDQELCAELARLAAGAVVQARLSRTGSRAGRVVWQFPGQDAQRPGMARAWYEFSPDFRRALDRACAVADACLGQPLLPLLLGDDHEPLRNTSLAQPALFCLEWSFAECLTRWFPGIEPYLTGHSLGAYVAACRAGCWSLEHAVELVVERGRCFERAADQSRMIVVRADPERVAAVLGEQGERVDIAAVNAAHQLVIAGVAAHVDACHETLTAAGLSSRVLNPRYGFHSRAMDEAIAQFAGALSRVQAKPTHTALISDLSGEILPAGTVLDADYWMTHARRTVRFDKVHARVAELDPDCVIELGPGSALTALACENGLSSAQAVSVAPARTEAWEGLLAMIGRAFEQGVEFDWKAFGRPFGWRRVDVPGYPFEQRRYWKPGLHEGQPAGPQSQPLPVSNMSEPTRDPSIANAIAAELAKALRVPEERIDRDANLLDLGIDSLMLMGAIDFIESRFGVRLSVSEFFGELNTVHRIAARLDAAQAIDAAGAASIGNAPPSLAPHEAVDAWRAAPANAESFRALFQHQLDTVSRIIDRQLAALGQASADVPMTPAPAAQRASAERAAPPVVASRAVALMPFQSGKGVEKASRTSRQDAYLRQFAEQYNRRTSRSKAYADAHRLRLADNRMVSGFRLGTKELVYPIVSERALGAHIWDIDDHRYLDLTMGFGVALFGHNAPFVAKALRVGVDQGYSLGPQSSLAGEVAGLLCEITGHERATFANTGSEAVMLAVRLARAATGRPWVVLFAGSYHGTADTVMARPGERSALPFAPGITPRQIEDVVVLDYGAAESLDFVRRHADQIAAVLVEPVQSRNPSLQPRAFLHALRALTRATGIALVFDEVLNGFRIHLRGGQGHYGIEADLAAYGKIVGGGLPIGMVAGAARYLDHIDGGAWSYRDDSYPAVPMTFFAGTFCKHPLAMQAAKVVLERLKSEGEAIVTETNAKTTRFVERVNAATAALGVDLHVAHCGSLFRIPQLPDIELLHYGLINRGLYIWEGRNCFLSHAHDDAELEQAATTFGEVVGELAEHGFLGVDPGSGPSGASGNRGARSTPAAEEPVALSTEQVQLLALFDLDDPRWSAYNVPVAIEIAGRVDAGRLERAFQAVVGRHEALRMQVAVGAEPTLRIATQAEPALQCLSIEAPTLDRTLAELLRHRFDPYREYPIRAYLIGLDDGRSVLLLLMHHLLVDGWSAGIVLEDLLRFYDAPPTADIEPAPLFRRVVARRREARRSDAYRAIGARLRTRFIERDVVGAAVGELGGTAGGQDPWRAHQCVHVFEAADAERLARCARERGMTLFQLLVAAYGAAMHRVSGRRDITLAVPVGARRTREEHGLVGYCSNLCLIASSCGETLADLPAYAAKVKQALLDTLQCDEYAYADLVDDARRLGRLAAIAPDAVINLERRADIAPGSLDGLRWRPVMNEHVAFPQFVNFIDDGERLSLAIDHIASVPADALLQAFLTSLSELAHGAAAVPGVPSVLPAPAPEPLDEDGDGWLAAFVRHALREPERTALRQGGAVYTYGELLARALCVARAIAGQGIAVGEPVGVCMEPGRDRVAALLGVLLSGACYVPLDPSYPRERNAYCLNDAGARVVIVEMRTVPLLSLPAGCRALDFAACVPDSRSNADSLHGLRRAAPGSLAYLIYTSGSTGMPKGVAVARSSLDTFLLDMTGRWSVTSRDCFVNLTPMSFDIAALEVFLPLVSAASCVMLTSEQRLDGVALAAVIRDQQVTVLQATPGTWRLIQEAQARLPALRIGAIGGEAPPRGMVDYIQSLGADAWNLYGPTEATVWASAWQADRSDRVLLGEPLAGVERYVLDAEGDAVGVGETGELYLGGTGLALGYWKRPGLTASRFVPHPWRGDGARLFRTGDVVRQLADGQLQFLNRIDDQVKLRGYRVELGEIEAVAHLHAGVAQAVCRLDNGADEPQLVLYASPRQGGALESHALRQYLARHLPAYMVPARIVVVDAFKRTPNGKVDRGALSAPQGVEASAPPGEVEAPLLEGMLAIWRDALDDAELTLDTDFFDAGGYSLRAAKVISLSRQRLNLTVKYDDIVAAPTARALTCRLSGGTGDARVNETGAAEVDQHEDPSLFRPPRPEVLPTGTTWAHVRFVLSVLAMHVPAVPLVLSYKMVRRLAPSLGARLRRALPRLFARTLLFAAGARVEVSGLQHIPRDARPLLVLSNHGGRFDAYLLMANLPFAYKSFSSNEDHVTTEKLTLFSWIERTFDLTFMHDKRDAEATEHEFRRARDYLGREGRLALFPEGGMSGARVAPVGEACCLLAAQTGALVIPAAIVDSHRLYESNGARYAPARVHVRFGEPIRFDGAGGNVRQMAVAMRKVLQDLLDDTVNVARRQEC
ncbi:amino acid adenylation domain-containing protein [Burkholderia sp. FERM BP-3421]|uniref:non-ribosomal peptide synthetase/type I polyketide synthase n=1 Tax=Burkholderia sp. FERM BP-3421 TaxID=1494466 RepID=UPI0023615C36|nr:non-ribosomal peptide synthetase/type I polyketide synthase [Burkholderia sp. FERM BP-3421]WDD92409.1 amino acid adenylation domain-containing protein [Burkholderia sp. FERM BP-3421]